MVQEWGIYTQDYIADENQSIWNRDVESKNADCTEIDLNLYMTGWLPQALFPFALPPSGKPALPTLTLRSTLLPYMRAKESNLWN